MGLLQWVSQKILPTAKLSTKLYHRIIFLKSVAIPFWLTGLLKSKSGQSFAWKDSATFSLFQPLLYCLFSIPYSQIPPTVAQVTHFFLSHLVPSLSRGWKFSESTTGDSGCKIVTLNDTQASRKIAQPVEVAIAIKRTPLGNDSEPGYEMGRTRFGGGPSRLTVCLSSSPSKCSLRLECFAFHLQSRVVEGGPRVMAWDLSEMLPKCLSDILMH